MSVVVEDDGIVRGTPDDASVIDVVTDVDADTIAPGLSEDVVRLISAKKNEPQWLLDWRLKAYRRWLTMSEPHWPNVTYTPIDYQKARYYSAPKSVKPLQSLDEVDPELLKTYDKLGISLTEQKFLAGVAVDAIFDSVSVGTTMKDELAKHGVVFCSFTEAVHHYPELIQKYLGSVVPYSDNFFAALNSVEMATQPWALLQWMGEKKDSTALKFFDDWVRVHRLKHLEAVLAERDWLAGSFSVPDILLADALRLVDRFDGLAASPVCKRYVERATARPAFKKAHADQMAHFAAADKDKAAKS